jgi:hypothetical protein
MAQQAASVATLHSNHQYDYAIARNTTRIVPIKEEEPAAADDEIQITYCGPSTKDSTEKDAPRKRKSLSTSSSSIESTSSTSSIITIDAHSNSTLAGPSKKQKIITSASVPELTSSYRPVSQTPLPEMASLTISRRDNFADLEDGEVLDDATNGEPLPKQLNFVEVLPDRGLQSAIRNGPPIASAASEEASAKPKIYQPGDVHYDPLLDDEEMAAVIYAELPEDEDFLLNDVNVLVNESPIVDQYEKVNHELSILQISH